MISRSCTVSLFPNRRRKEAINYSCKLLAKQGLAIIKNIEPFISAGIQTYSRKDKAEKGETPKKEI